MLFKNAIDRALEDKIWNWDDHKENLKETFCEKMSSWIQENIFRKEEEINV